MKKIVMLLVMVMALLVGSPVFAGECSQTNLNIIGNAYQAQMDCIYVALENELRADDYTKGNRRMSADVLHTCSTEVKTLNKVGVLCNEPAAVVELQKGIRAIIVKETSKARVGLILNN